MATDFIPAGEYPTGTIDAFKQLHISGNFAPGLLGSSNVEQGDPTGLYHLIVGEGQNAFVGNGKCQAFLCPGLLMLLCFKSSDGFRVVSTANITRSWWN